MSRLQLRAALLAQGRETTPPEDPGSAWVLDATRLPAGYTLSNGNQTAVNTLDLSRFGAAPLNT